ncbi:hypothetical protein AB3X89_24005 [Paraburkholderia sp. BR14320]|uniref:hypothetical protein n=2 Tax=Paraburkholderia TaxID=1822464 RepID=UPI0034CDE029
MNSANSSPWKYVITWLRLYFGAHLFFSGIRFVIDGYVPMIPGLAGQYVAGADAVGMYHWVKYMEAVYGALLLMNRFVFLTLILEMPTTVTIFWLNTFISATPRQLFSGPQELLMNGILLLAYSGYMAVCFRPTLNPMWLWDGWKGFSLKGKGGSLVGVPAVEQQQNVPAFEQRKKELA